MQLQHLISIILSLLAPPTFTAPCKAIPGTPSWPCDNDWAVLNRTVEGHLLKPPPTAAVCHQNQPNFDQDTCNATDWTSAVTYAEDPLGIINPNWANDSCLPPAQLPCSGSGYPVYVINASCAEHVAAGVDFARTHNVRLNVKGSGHDYLGRSNARDSLSIWTKHIRGIEFHDKFKPTGCRHCSSTPAVRLGAGESWGDIYAAADARGLTLVGGTGDTIGLGGYLTGGGHSPLSAMLGLAADQVLEMELVTASGQHVIANEVLHKDLFWAMRGGGGATFGIMTSVTLKTFSQMRVASVGIEAATDVDSDAFWDLVTLVFSSAPKLQERNVMGYTYISPSFPYNGTTIGGLMGIFLLPNGTLAELTSATAFLQDSASAIPGVLISYNNPKQHESMFAYYTEYKNQDPIGVNSAVGNRLLGAETLSNTTRLRAALQKATPSGALANVNLIAGPGLRSARPAGGDASINPAWRAAYLEYVAAVTWPFLNDTAKAVQTDLLTNTYVEALRELAPDGGSYLNEGDVNEPDWQQTYYGINYARLLSIKRATDPTDVFWCAVCVGSEGWTEEDGRLCRV